MAYETVLYSVEDGVARVVMNRPEYLNAQNAQLLNDMDAAFAEAEKDPGVKIIVLSGEGRHFSAGHDIGSRTERERRQGGAYQPTRLSRYEYSRTQFLEKSLRWRNILKPTLAMVHGYCIWGGWLVASSMDLIFASDDAFFLGTHFQYFSIPWDLGARKTMEILYQNRFLPAREAHELGLVNQVFPRQELEPRTLAYAREVAENDLSTLRRVKLSVLQMMDGMGFSNHVRGAFHTTPFGPIAGPQDAPPSDSRRRMAPVERALQKLAREGKGQNPS